LVGLQDLEQLYIKQEQQQRQQQQQEVGDEGLLDMLYAAQEQQQQLGEEEMLDLLYIKSEEQQQQVQRGHPEEQLAPQGDRVAQPALQQQHQQQGLEAHAVTPPAAAAAGGAAAAAALPRQLAKRGRNRATSYKAVDGTRIWLKVCCCNLDALELL
jgi:hypothetical protein